MNSIFSTCLGEQGPEIDKLATILPQPLKFRFVNTVNLFNFILKYFAQPRKQQKYTFCRNNLHFLINQKSHVPIIYFPSAFPQLSMIIIYCHGSGSTLNNVYDFSYSMSVKYGIAFMAYDYTGDGESERQFNGYQQDLKLVLAWAVRLGYRLNRVILCGFSLGSYSALCLEGEMPRILVSPICGIISFFQTEGAQYEGEKYNNVEKALLLKCKSLIFHCSQELVHISHGKLIQSALQHQSKQESIFYEITDRIYQHRSAPSFLCSLEGEKIIANFLSQVNKATKKADLKDPKTCQLLKQLQNMDFMVRDDSGKQTKNDLSLQY